MRLTQTSLEVKGSWPFERLYGNQIQKKYIYTLFDNCQIMGETTGYLLSPKKVLSTGNELNLIDLLAKQVLWALLKSQAVARTICCSPQIDSKTPL